MKVSAARRTSAQGTSAVLADFLDACERWLIRCSRRPGRWLAAFSVLLGVQITPLWYSTPDTVVYLSMARSIATRHRLAALGNLQLGLPPGYPLLISPAFLFSDRPFFILSIIHWGMAILLMLGVYRWFHRRWPVAALALTGLVMVNVSVWIHYRRPLSELAFMTVLIWTVQALNAVLTAQSSRRALWRTVPASGLLVLLSMIREVGVFCGLGFCVGALINVRRARMRWPAAIVLSLIVGVPSALAVAGFLLPAVAMKASSVAPLGTHVDGLMHPPVAAPTERLTEGVRLRITDIGQLLIPGMFNAYARQGNWLDLNDAVFILVSVFVAIGWWKLVRNTTDVFALTLPFYLLAYVVWAFPGNRYMLPMLPVLLASVWYVIEPLRRRRLPMLAVLFAAHLAVAVAYWVLRDLPRARMCDAQWSTVEQLAASIDHDPRTVATSNVPECVVLMLALRLDRPVRLPRADASIDPNAGWVLMPESDRVAAGFVPVARAAPYLLARKLD